MKNRLPVEHFHFPVEKIKAGYYTDAYFLRTEEILNGDNHHPRVMMQLFTREPVVVCGIDETIALIKTCAHNPENITIHALHDGDEVAPWETLMTIEGDLADFAHLETIYLGFLARQSRIATNVRRVVKAANGKPVLFFPARYDTYQTQESDGYAAMIEKVTVSLENLISELARNPSLFLKNPDTDFSRNRKINFKTCVGITMNSGGCTLNKELLDFFDFDVNAPTVSAYTQQRAKILPEAFEYLFHAFTEENAQTKNLYEGYQLLACDGSNLTIAPNLNDPETLWKSNQLGATGNHLHLNALYDVLNRTYIDALVQTASTYQEHRACIQMIETHRKYK